MRDIKQNDEPPRGFARDDETRRRTPAIRDAITVSICCSNLAPISRCRSEVADEDANAASAFSSRRCKLTLWVRNEPECGSAFLHEAAWLQMAAAAVYSAQANGFHIRSIAFVAVLPFRS